jgi:hypothetical protein
MSSVVKFILAILLFASTSSHAREINILVIGDGSAAGCNEYRFQKTPHVHQLGKDGNVKSAQDPLDWSECQGGSIWIPVGEGLVSSGIAQDVVFLSIGLPETHVQDWSVGGKAYPALEAALALAERKKIRFDYALWQQGHADAGFSANQYYNNLRGVIKFVSLRTHVKSWIIAQGTGCPGMRIEGVETADERMGNLKIYNRFPGPNTRTLSMAERYGQCGLVKAGQYRLADMWVKSIIDADKRARSFQKESLLYYFR